LRNSSRFARDSPFYPGLFQKTVLCSWREILFSFFNSFKKSQSDFLKELKKEIFMAARGENSLLKQPQPLMCKAT
jgi:hypothetical protein